MEKFEVERVPENTNTHFVLQLLSFSLLSKGDPVSHIHFHYFIIITSFHFLHSFSLLPSFPGSGGKKKLDPLLIPRVPISQKWNERRTNFVTYIHREKKKTKKKNFYPRNAVAFMNKNVVPPHRIHTRIHICGE